MRLMLAGTHSGCGKTTASLALMRTLEDSGLRVAPFKAGPDYIDPGFHRLAAGRSSNNLDLFLMGEKGVRQVLQWGRRNADISIIEAAMGYYDGIGAEGRCSAYELAVYTDTPVVLVVDASGSASCAAATALGFRVYMPDSRIAAVLVNRVSSRSHYELVRQAVERRTGLPCAGYIEKNARADLKSRHLGLVPAGELDGFQNKLDVITEAFHPDLDMLKSIASAGKETAVEPMEVTRRYNGFAMGVAMDEAFSFYYEANIEMLRRMGMRIVAFSPLRDETLPEGLDGLWLGGGFPEVFAEALSANETMRTSVRRAVEGGLPTYAECGGMMYLGRTIDGRAMAGVLPVDFKMTDRLQHFGYVCARDRLSGIEFPAHEFHHSVMGSGEGTGGAFEVRRASGRGQPWTGGIRRGNLLAGYPHVHFWGRPELVRLLWNLDGEGL